MSGSHYTHLKPDERKIIESDLNHPDITLKVIADHLGRSEKCIRNEILKHRQLKIRSNQKNKCGKQEVCEKQRLCTHCIQGLCKFCRHDNCNQICSEFVSEPVCPRTARFPFVCSGCPDLGDCRLPKFFYYAEISQTEYKLNVSKWKAGPQKTDMEMKKIDEAVRKGVKQGWSLDIIIHKCDLDISLPTLYRYIEKHYIDGISNIDLKRKVRYKPRKTSKPVLTPINYDYLNGRRYEDFTKRILEEDPSINIWEMDTVEGKKGDNKCVLSLLHRKSNLQFYFLLGEQTILEVTRIFDAIKDVLGPDLFKKTFPIILTDNGHEFHDPLAIETYAGTGEKLIDVYFCEARRSDEKGKCEKNHEHFRECIPKGVSMEPLSKHDINHVSNMVNNYPRPMLNYHSPYEIASLFLNEKVFILNRLKHLNFEFELTPIIH